jgi:hypothetical protein
MEENVERKFLYRYEEAVTAECLDEYENPIMGTSTMKLYVYRYEIIRHTPKGVWINQGWGYETFVNLTARNRYACPTKEEAWESFRERKRRQRDIVAAQLARATGALKLDPMKAVDVERGCIAFS